jgi:hypothetical protein
MHGIKNVVRRKSLFFYEKEKPLTSWYWCSSIKSDHQLTRASSEKYRGQIKPGFDLPVVMHSIEGR